MPWFRRTCWLLETRHQSFSETAARSSFRFPAPVQGRENVGEIPPNFRSQLVHELSLLARSCGTLRLKQVIELTKVTLSLSENTILANYLDKATQENGLACVPDLFRPKDRTAQSTLSARSRRNRRRPQMCSLLMSFAVRWVVKLKPPKMQRLVLMLGC